MLGTRAESQEICGPIAWHWGDTSTFETLVIGIEVTEG